MCFFVVLKKKKSVCMCCTLVALECCCGFSFLNLFLNIWTTVCPLKVFFFCR